MKKWKELIIIKEEIFKSFKNDEIINYIGNKKAKKNSKIKKNSSSN